MKKQKPFALIVFAALIFACLQTAAFGQTANDDRLANVSGGGSNIRWEVVVANSGTTLIISVPDGRIFRREFRAGATPEFNLTDRQIEKLPDGSYGYELRLNPVLSAGAKETLMAGRAKDDDSETERTARKHPSVPSQVQSGAFSILNGSIVIGGAVEGQRTGRTTNPRTPAVASGNTETRLRQHRLALSAIPDDVIPDDLIVQGSACIGLDCVNNESFGFDTIRLKENNTRIKFDDTSTSAGFPANDWQLTANDSASGGSSKFSIEDITGAKVPFTIRAGAATNSIFVDSTGRLGLRTSTPVLDVHVNTSNTPAIRLEQNSSGGFTAQTWDIAGNEANFFVRDVTGGSRLPFRIRPGAPTSSVDISATGNVGIGTASPGNILSIVQNQNGNSFASILNNDAGATAKAYFITDNGTNTLRFQQNGTGFGGIGASLAGEGIVYQTAPGLTLMVDNASGIMKFATGGTSEKMRITSIGRVGIGTTVPDQLLSVNGDASKTGGNTWLSFSDERLKNIKGTYNSGLKAVMRLQPIRYEYKPDNVLGLKSEGEHIGFGAQALQKVIPEAVTKNGDGYLMVNSDPILWTMLNAIKEQQKEIADLKAEVQKLRAASHRRRK